MDMDVELDGLFRHNDTYDYENYEEEIEPGAGKAVLTPVLYSVVLVVGLLGNGLLLAILAQKRRSWSITDTFILHLSVADILLLVTLPFWAAQAAQQNGWRFGGFLCKISGAVFNINFYCGIFLLLVISLDRYLSIVHATQPFSQKKPRLAHISCLSVWIFSLFLSIPDCAFLVVKRDPVQAKTLCVHSFSQSVIDWQLLSCVLHQTLGFLLPAAALVVCCSCILQKQRAITFILPLVVVFLLCWVPYNITLIVDTFRSRSKKPAEPESSLKTAVMVTSALGCMHACIRPLLYFGLCRNFRKQTLAMFRGTKVESESSLWGLGVGEEALPDQNAEGEALKRMESKGHQVQSTQC
ncbi:C-X-C chemokine receptor type 3-like [Cyclopterus lumpus]|uniref:Chemokine (C-X-C motif) receptor 3, tandem duplicate 3 n=1 Tax=Cyclopterus lumpus TaxID=8103 RepID=A0A8C2ZLL5_CYCLU|nr:C-X-C chemokine receptor type 3-like [Cyclopterus lumpus]XP_034409197.1 C-X-C chemokine receptor type 3-like [Cyclopterus lumpus]XP_034409198.1 C-X-C chemokine receptor type 3-like [Cyclopterus lumpus]